MTTNSLDNLPVHIPFFDIRGMACCGYRELAGIQAGTLQTTVTHICYTFVTGYKVPYSRDKFQHIAPTRQIPFITFTDHIKRSDGTLLSKRGLELAAFIRENKLGDVFESGERRNPNSGNNIKVWVWTVDWDAMTKYTNEVLLPKKAPEIAPQKATEGQGEVLTVADRVVAAEAVIASATTPA